MDGDNNREQMKGVCCGGSSEVDRISIVTLEGWRLSFPFIRHSFTASPNLIFLLNGRRTYGHSYLNPYGSLKTTGGKAEKKIKHMVPYN